MNELFTEKKLLYRLLILSLITTPLFGLLGGTPFLSFDFKELHDFLPGIYFVAATTFLFWVVNISLLLLSEKFIFLKRIVVRAMASIVIGIFLSAGLFYIFQPIGRQQKIFIEAGRVKIESMRPAFAHISEQGFGPGSPANFGKPPARFFLFPPI